MPNLDNEKIEFLKAKARAMRISIIEMLVSAGSGHTAGPLGMADVFSALYFHVLNHRPEDPMWEDRDRLMLSNGHICPVRYAAMAHAGYFPIEELMTLRKLGTRLQGHPHRTALPGVETTSGPLGSGLGQAAGYAYAARMDKKNYRIYCAMSDGEQQCGNTWESAMFAGKNKLSNLTGIIDRNHIQISGTTEDVMPIEPLVAKYQSFGWNVLECDGHDFTSIIGAVDEAKQVTDMPTVIIAHTIPGKGIKEIEGDYRWHGKPPSKEEAVRFLTELRS